VSGGALTFISGDLACLAVDVGQSSLSPNSFFCSVLFNCEAKRSFVNQKVKLKLRKNLIHERTLHFHNEVGEGRTKFRSAQRQPRKCPSHGIQYCHRRGFLSRVTIKLDRLI